MPNCLESPWLVKWCMHDGKMEAGFANASKAGVEKQKSVEQHKSEQEVIMINDNQEVNDSDKIGNALALSVVDIANHQEPQKERVGIKHFML